MGLTLLTAKDAKKRQVFNNPLRLLAALAVSTVLTFLTAELHSVLRSMPLSFFILLPPCGALLRHREGRGGSSLCATLCGSPQFEL